MNILPIYPPPLIIRGYNFEERQCEGILGQKWDGYFQPKRYFQSPLLESKIDQIQMTMKWKDQVLDHCWHEEVQSLLDNAPNKVHNLGALSKRCIFENIMRDYF